ncbi:MAG TPA: hypothetical protein VG167_20855 [Verrucomicrobiae bacterium]|nr:hypothetical protein [Verrucomicrobiae bacterium]
MNTQNEPAPATAAQPAPASPDPAPALAILPAPATATQPPSSPPRRTRRNGLVARLPKPERDMVSRMIYDGVPYLRIVAALEELEIFVTPRNISNWKTGGGYREWRAEQTLALETRLFRPSPPPSPSGSSSPIPSANSSRTPPNFAPSPPSSFISTANCASCRNITILPPAGGAEVKTRK